ncbi:MAG: hypothetical protein KJ626_08865 [Verrucomicrobia bacterium]|nr:hypothetical protein [Verrucomicrobiota bacterium]
MKTCRSCSLAPLSGVVVVFLLFPLISSATTISTYEDLAEAYVNERAWLSILLPYQNPYLVEDIEEYMAANDWSFQKHEFWYYSCAGGSFPYDPDSEIGQAIAAGAWVGIFEDLEADQMKIITVEGRELAAIGAEPWPFLQNLSENEYQDTFAWELHKRRLVWWVDFESQEPQQLQTASAPPMAGGFAMMGMGGGSNDLWLDIEGPASGIEDIFRITVHTPLDFTNRVEIFVTDELPMDGTRATWTLADSGLVSTDESATIIWQDTGQLGRTPVWEQDRQYITAASTFDTDGDGYFDGYELYVNHSNPNDADSDDDGVSDGPLAVGSATGGPDAFPTNASESIDTDLDGIGDNADTDDDGDGIADGSDAEALIPIVVARHKNVDVSGGSFASSYSSMTSVGEFQGWNAAENNMRLVADYTWAYTAELQESTGTVVKFTANGGWAANWGDNNQGGTTLPISGIAEVSGSDISLTENLNGLYTFTFHETSLAYSLEAATSADNEDTFDVSSSGRTLPYASGGDARGFGQLHGGIYFNNDETNLYIGIAGFEKGTNADNVLMLFIDADETTSGASSLANVSSGPAAFSVANNLSFNATNFMPEVGILVGNRFADGRNYPDMSIGQGVYSLSSTAAADFPGFDLKNGAISQWGDRGSDSANAGIEIALSLSSLGLSVGDTFRAAAIVAGGGDDAPNRWFSGEAYGDSVSGTLSGSDFQNSSIILVGAQVYISSQPAPAYGGPPPFDEDDIILQGFTWDVPRPALSDYLSMTVAGNFFSSTWDAAANNMTLIGDYTWEYIHTFTNETGVAFKFTADGAWDDNWGDDSQGDTILPINEEAADKDGADITISGTVDGLVRFRINTKDETYDVEAVSGGTTTKLLPGISAVPWYVHLQQQAESNAFARFTMIWMNPAAKCSSGINSVGYDWFDPFDNGTYAEKGTTATRYGAEAQLQACMTALKSKGISPLADLVLNHMHGGYSLIDVTNSLYRYNYEPLNHNTFEKSDTNAPQNEMGYFNVSIKNQPFEQDLGFGNPSGVNPEDDEARSADINHRHPYMRQGLKNHVNWYTAKFAAEGYRWDYSQGIPPWFISEVMGYELMKGKLSILEYWEKAEQSTDQENLTWLALNDYRSAMFDMRFHEAITEMCNLNGDFDMSLLASVGLINANALYAVTFPESHDTIRPYGSGDPAKLGITQDKMLAYAPVMIGEGLPMVPYSDYFLGPNVNIDPQSNGWSGTPLKPEIDEMADIRRKYAGGSTSYLSTMNKSDLFIMKRNGNATKPGCILVLNDNMSSTLYDTGVNTGWISTNLVDALDTNHVVSTDASGSVSSPGLSAPARGYRVYVPQGELQ